MTPRKGAGLIVGLAVAAVLTVPLSMSMTDARDASCTGVDVERASDARISNLLDAGWAGDPTDGREALYPPTCTIMHEED